MTIADVLQLFIGPFGVAVLALALLYGKYQGWWYTGPEVQALQQELLETQAERDQMFQSALEARGAGVEIMELVKWRLHRSADDRVGER